jgi:hypothetical protein
MDDLIYIFCMQRISKVKKTPVEIICIVAHEDLKATHQGTICILYNITKIEKLPYPPQVTLHRYQGWISWFMSARLST